MRIHDIAPGLCRGLKEAMFSPSSSWDLFIPLIVQRPPQEAETKPSQGWLERGIREYFIAPVSAIILFS